ncbi:MAG: D-amino-acid transaminase [Alphaproteobacteria bacterium]|nr:D-amino-acid transaminase [Alphaproteobacteria bacterium]MBU0797052.1 D-amino-acid transaminase [Alphaproteobacteria bacterium]MBU0887860.1 D-amino-acid transaminase [Alphaproteobacteria bacterium]MBU1814917.1 D-amino-acid transaminase [Alphaproteobacteria bacterium]MBU2090505.1 D-amino-acid transaminase [Alphaproteobacteria bacterium]
MSRIAYVNGRYVPHGDAAVHVEDRGYQFADGVYEVVTVVNGRLIDEEPHLDRLWRSLGELRIDIPMSRAAIKAVTREVIRRNLIRTGLVYMQVTRGVARRDHPFPKKGTPPAVVMTAKHVRLPSRQKVEDGVKVITIRDIRWERCDIKTVSLLPNILGKQQAREAGATEAWQVDDDGMVTEGTSTNAWIITKEGELITRPATNDILNGITRLRILKLAEEEGVKFVERAFSAEEALQAREAFISSATSFVTPVTQINDTVIGNGKAGSVSLKLRDWYESFMDGMRESA